MRPRCSYVVPFRSDAGGVRRRNLDAVLGHVSTLVDVELVVVEVAAEPSSFPARVNHVHVTDTSPFNKSWAMNIGFRMTRSSVVAFADADVIVPTETINRSVSAVERDFDAVKPFEVVVDLDWPQTLAFLASSQLPNVENSGQRNRRANSEDLPFCGGLFFCRRDAFESAGGYDERFIGWGGEDDAMSMRLARTGARLGSVPGGVAFHLWHPQSLDRYRDSTYRKNRDRLASLSEYDDAQFRELCRGDAARMGSRAGPIRTS